MRTPHDELRAGLHEAAEAYEPDRARILARVERGMAAPAQKRPRRRATRPPLLGWARVVGATAAVSGILAMGGYALASVVKSDETPADPTVSVSPLPTPSPDATSRAPIQPAPEPSGGNAHDDRPSSTPTPAPTPKASNTVAAPDAKGAEDGPLWSDGSVDPHSNDFWAQSNVTVKTSEQLTALTVELRIAQTGGVTSTGAWRSAPEDDFDLTVAERDGFLIYTWVLKDGRKVPPGEWVFAGQYDHTRGGRDAKDDRYTVTGEAAGEQLAVKGDFAGQDDSGTSDEGDS
ncbi:hypothetical protein ACOT81_10635 [Streptomyces sp. WI04-05B]|uniref:hypothetical protein n=1 Tax=Streptomyces TaxID=1883 RepID=UPI0029A07910|nr:MULTISPECIES: hypothetical protein [unclassified Streptomyces]MDX2541100.1 hypothetical protein [Streptomyces sp. WI04-05B]MDX2585670.1 hypothetical protein [Streptomyces sp. WI04-05A]MDX3752183.1 hypothetical protein [Streptomyces sp. AK08-02]